MNPLSERLGIELPIIQAPMAGAQDAALAIAVADAGGLGSLPCAMLGHDKLLAELVHLAASTTRPINLNFFCHRVPTPDARRERRWRAALAPFYRELGLDPEQPLPRSTRRPIDDAAVDILDEFRPQILSFHFGLPDERLLARMRAWKPLILSTATTVAEARWLAERGIDLIIAQGLEAGGHRGQFLADDLDGQLPMLDLVAAIGHAVRTPLIAAGGIVCAEDVRDALAAGAIAAQVGTAYLCCAEATTAPVHRVALADAEHVTAITNLISGRPARGIVNRLMRELGPMSRLPPEFPLAAPALAPLRTTAEADGRGDFSALWSGTRRPRRWVDSAAEVTRELADRA